MSGTIQASIWRGAADGGYVTYEVPRQPKQTVLDLVTHVQRHLDPSLSYRFACRVGMCGSCAMSVDGRPRWTCRTLTEALGDTVRIGPLAHMPVVKDLAVDMTAFFDKWAAARGWFDPGAEPAADFATVPPESPQRRAADAAIECIGCGICYAACEVVAWNPDYLGPAALNRAWSLVNDARDRGQAERLDAVAGDAGCHSCHSHQSCREHCPKHLNPTGAIAGLKRATARAALKGRP